MNTATHVRWMIRRDMVDVLAIENRCFGQHAWSEEEFVRQLRQRNCIGMVVEEDATQAILGYMVYALEKKSLEILTIAVDPHYQRCGIGWQMIDKLIGKLSAKRRTKITAAVRDANLDAHLFFKAMGFRAQVPILRRYFENGEDAYRFAYRYRDEPQGIAVAEAATAA
jgi:ribosomal-protein-alanine N-acetyltransferase